MAAKSLKRKGFAGELGRHGNSGHDTATTSLIAVHTGFLVGPFTV